MNVLATVSAETAALVAVVAAILLTILVFRDPFRPAWLRSRLAVEVAAVLIAAVFAIALGAQMSGLIAAGLTPLSALAIAPTITLVAAVGFWRLFDCGERLRRADAGRPAFGRPGDKPGVPPGAARGGGNAFGD
jgi:hypothetical protein